MIFTSRHNFENINNNLRILASNANNLVFRIDRKYNINFINNAALDFFKVDVFDSIGKKCSHIFNDEEFFCELSEQINKVINNKKSLKKTIEFDKNIRCIHLEFFFLPEFDDSETVENILCISNDITNIIRSSEKIKRTERLKRSFLNNISHEIRTPLNVILGFSEILRDEETDNEKIQYLKQIEKAGNNLLDTFNNIMEISRLESNSVLINYQCVKLSDIKKYIVDYCIEKYDFSLEDVHFSKGFVNDFEFYTDKNYIFRIFGILIDNAVKFSNCKNVFLSCYIKENKINFVVKDQGTGIEKNIKRIIYEPFVQGEESLRREFGGLGLGLSIVAGLLRILGGKIRILRSSKKGTTFRFDIFIDKSNII